MPLLPPLLPESAGDSEPCAEGPAVRRFGYRPLGRARDADPRPEARRNSGNAPSCDGRTRCRHELCRARGDSPLASAEHAARGSPTQRRSREIVAAVPDDSGTPRRPTDHLRCRPPRRLRRSTSHRPGLRRPRGRLGRPLYRRRPPDRGRTTGPRRTPMATRNPTAPDRRLAGTTYPDSSAPDQAARPPVYGCRPRCKMWLCSM